MVCTAQRDEDRKFLYLEYLLTTIKTNLPRWTIEVMFHEENLEPCMLKAALKVLCCVHHVMS